VITLDNRKLLISNDEIVGPQSTIVSSNEGMPLYQTEETLDSEKHRSEKGDLIVRFNIEFPKTLDEAQKRELEMLLS
jgi:DnaJ-class molecular chaperone